MSQEGLRRSLAAVLVTGLLLLGTGCMHHSTESITSRLILDDIYNDYQVKPKNLSAESKCAAQPAVRIVNAEKRTEEIVEYKAGVHTFLVKPSELMDGSVAYLKGGFEKSGIKGSGPSDKTIELKLASLEGTQGMWVFGAKVRVELDIPEKGLTKFYEASENGQISHTIFADCIHLITRQIIEDRAIQNYLLCR